MEVDCLFLRDLCNICNKVEWGIVGNQWLTVDIQRGTVGSGAAALTGLLCRNSRQWKLLNLRKSCYSSIMQCCHPTQHIPLQPLDNLSQMCYEIWGETILGSLPFKADVSEDALFQASLLQQCTKLVISFVYTLKKLFSIYPPLVSLRMIDNRDIFSIIKGIVHLKMNILS